MQPAAVLSVLVMANTRQASAGLMRFQGQLRTTEGRAQSLGNTMKSALKVGAFGAGAGLAYSVKKAADFESQLDSLGSVSAASGREMEKFRKQAMKAGADTKFSALDAAVAQTELAKGGLSVRNIMRGGLKSALALAAAGEMDLGEAAATTANALNLFGLEGKSSMKVADALAKAANATTADVTDFAMALRQSGGVAKTAGLSFTETVLALEALANAGTKNSDAGTSLKTALLQLIGPTAKQRELQEKLGLEFINSEGSMKSMTQISTMLRGSLGKMGDAQRAATLKVLAGTDGVRTLTALYDAGPEKLDKWRTGLQKSGTAAEVAARKQDNLKGKLENLQGSVETIAIAFGSKLLPALTEAAEKVTDVLNDKQLSGAQKFDQLGKMAADAIGKAGPIVAAAAAKVALIGVRGFFNAFRESPIWLKLLTVGFVASKLGLVSIFTKSGAQAGAAFGAGFGTGAAPAMAASAKAQAALTGGQLIHGKQFRSGAPTSQVGPKAYGMARVGQGIAGQAKKLAPQMRAVGKTVLGVALVTGIADAATRQGIKGFGDRFQQAASSATLGFLPAPKAIDERLATIAAKIRTWKGGNLKLSDASDPDNSLIKAEDLDDFTGRQRKMLMGLATLRNTATEFFGKNFKFTPKMEINPKAAVEKLRLLENEFGRMRSGAVLNVKELRSVTAANFARIAGTMGTKSEEGQKQVARNFRLAVGNIVDFKQRGILNASQAGRQIAFLMKSNTGKGQKAVAENMLAAQRAIARTMTRSGKITQEGTDLIRALMVNAMKNMGLSPDTIRMSLNKKASAKKGFTQPGQTGLVVTGGKPAGDSVHALLERGEVVINRKAVEKMGGPQQVNKINQQIPRFQSGGVAGMVSAANRLDKAQFPYLWGGGHQGSPAPFGPMDCSGAVSYVLQHGGVQIPTMVSGALAGAGQPGPGKVTVFADPGHTFMRIGNRYFGTSGDNPGGGAGWFPDPGSSYKSRFTQRHFAAAGKVGGFDKVPQITVDAPESMMKTMVQGALDKTRAGANKKLRQVAATAIGSGDAGDPGPFGGGGTPAKNRLLGLKMAKARGWGGANWRALDYLWGIGESAWDHHADNPTSSAFGIPQAMGHLYPETTTEEWRNSPAMQIDWGLDYIAGRHINPIGALNFWKAQSPHWYQKGGIVDMLRLSAGGPSKGAVPGLPGARKSPLEARAMRDGVSTVASSVQQTMAKGGIVGDGQRLAKQVWGKVKGLGGKGFEERRPKVLFGGDLGGPTGIYQDGRITLGKGFQRALQGKPNKLIADLTDREGDPIDPLHGRDLALNTLVHEMAHAAQPLQKLSKWETEGGAEAFTQWAAPKVYQALGVPYGATPPTYPASVARVLKEKSQDWIRHGQFIGRNKLAKGGVVGYAGDSLGVGTIGPLRALLDRKVEGHPSSGKSSSWGVGQLVKGAAQHVFDFGTNDATAGAIKASINRVDSKTGKKPIHVMTVNGTPAGGQSAALKNKAIRAAAHGDVNLVDWAAKHKGQLDSLGHGAYPERARLIAASIRRSKDAAPEKSGRAGKPFGGSLGTVLTKTLKTLRSSKSAKVRGTRLRQFEKRIRKQLGLPTKLQKQLEFLSTSATTIGDRADKAGQLNVDNEDGTSTLGVFQGKNEAGWSQDQLSVLWQWRNKLVDAVKIADKRRSEVAKLIARTRKRLEVVADRIRQTAKFRKVVEGDLKVARKKPKVNKRRIVQLKELLGRLDKDQKPRIRERKLLSDRILPALTGRRTALGELYGSLTGSEGLEGVQGPGGSMRRLGAIPPLGSVGGSLFDVQLRLKQLAAPKAAGAADSSAATSDDSSQELLRQLLREANLRTAVSQRQYDIFKNFDATSGALQQFATGGIVQAPMGAPLPVIAHGGEGVFTRDQMAAMGGSGGDVNVKLIFPPGMDFLKDKIRVEVENVTRRQARTAGRGLPGRGGGG